LVDAALGFALHTLGTTSFDPAEQQCANALTAITEVTSGSSHEDVDAGLAALRHARTEILSASRLVLQAAEEIEAYRARLGVRNGAQTALPPGTQIGASLSEPQGLTRDQFSAALAIVREGTEHIGGQAAVHGSRAAGTAGPGSDIDFAVRVGSERFDELLAERFGSPNPGSAKERTMQRAAQTGKIQAGEAGLSRLRRLLEAQLDMDVDLSIIRRDGPFDNPPFIGE
jgi:hypothetical protein